MRAVADDTKAAASLWETLELRQLETAARYLYVNSRLLPLVVIGMAGLLAFWHPLAPLVAWGVASILTWSGLGISLHRFLHDESRGNRRREWTTRLSVTLFTATCALTSVSLFFWVNNDRTNNVLLYVFVAAGMASAAAQSAPSRTLAIANLTPYGVVFVSLSLMHERFPFSIGFAALQCVYFALVLTYAKTVRQLAHEMLLLREEKRALIGRLQNALTDATAARRRAETASRAKSQFLANMSHELRTPLNAVLGFSEVIRDRLFGNDALPRYSEYASNIHISGTHLLGLINDVLDLSKIEAGKMEFAPEWFDLVADSIEALRFVEPQAARKDVRILRDMPDVLDVFADKRALRQIVVNLLSNAVKFTPQGGVVTLGLRRLADGSVTLAVSDTGIGIRPEDLERVLESFGQGRHDISPSEEQGTGLGLAIAKSLAEAHGGTLTLESEVGEGTTVTVTLPQGASAHGENRAA